MRLHEWRKDPVAVESAKKVLKGGTMKKLLEIANQEAPILRHSVPFGAPPTDYAYAHGMQRGFVYALEVIQRAGVLECELPDPPESTFSPENLG